jgi:hypothetical protein
MEDEILRPIAAFKPGTYRPTSAQKGFRDNLTSLTSNAFSYKEKGFAAGENPVPVLVKKLSGSFTVESTYHSWYTSHSKQVYAYSDISTTASRYLFPRVISPSTGLAKAGNTWEGSALAGYRNSKKQKVVTLETLVKREQRRLRRFRRNQELSLSKFEKRMWAAQAAWENRKEARLTRLNDQVIALQVRLDRITNLLIENREWREYLEQRSRKTDRIDQRIRKREDQVERLNERIAQVRAKIENLENQSFSPRHDWIPKVYTPRYYDFASQTALFPVSVPAKIKHTAPHPVDHIKYKASYNASNGVEAELNYQYVNGSQTRTVSQSIVLDNQVLIPGITSNWYIDRGGRFPYSSVDVESAARSIRWDIPQESDLPVFLAELSDTEQTIASAIRLYQSVRHFRVKRKIKSDSIRHYKVKTWKESFGELAKALSGADLSRKFAVDPGVDEAMTMVKATIESQVKQWKVLDRWLKNRGKVLSTHRNVGDVTTETNIREWPYSSLWSLQSISWPQGQGSYTNEWESDYPPEYEDQKGKEVSEMPVMDILDYIHSDGRSYFGQRPLLRNVNMYRKQDRLTVWYSYDAYDIFGWDLDDDEIRRRALLDRLGIFLDAKKVWELVPLSFVIDWFTNASQLLGKLSLRNLNPTYTIYGSMLSRKEDWIHTLQSVTPEVSLPSDQVPRMAVSRYRRQFISIDPQWVQEGKQITVRWKSPSWWQLITAIEMSVN